MSQPQVAEILQATTDSVTGWELNRFEPTPKFAEAIIRFLGYIPFNETEGTLGRRLHFARLASGKTQEQVAAQIGCDESTLRYIELDQRKPFKRTREKIHEFIDIALRSKGVDFTVT